MSKLTRLQVAEINKQSSTSCTCEASNVRIEELEIRVEKIEDELRAINEKLLVGSKAKSSKNTTKPTE